MPTRSPRLCARCRRIIPPGPCPHCAKPWSTSKRPRQNTAAQQRARWDRLVASPICAGYPEPGSCGQLAAIDDHVVPWFERGSMSYEEWDDEANHQNLCRSCHDAKTADESRRAIRSRPRR